jgi:hypothetical protein
MVLTLLANSVPSATGSPSHDLRSDPWRDAFCSAKTTFGGR